MAILNISPITHQMLLTVSIDQCNGIENQMSNGDIVKSMCEELYDSEVVGVHCDNMLVSITYANNVKYPSQFLVNRLLYPNIVVSFVG